MSSTPQGEAPWQLAERIERVTTTLNALDELVFVLDREGRFVDFHNPRGQDLFQSPETFLGQGFRSVLPPELAEPLAGKLAQVAAAGAPQDHEYPMLLAGRPTWWRARVSPRSDAAGACTGFTIISREITAQRQAEERISELNARLARRLDQLTEPGKKPGEVLLRDLFDLEELQQIQDTFAQATGVASIITAVDGTPITRPSNFCRLCEHIIRGTAQGRCNCYHSDAVLGRYHPGGPIMQQCLSGGLWDAGTSICAGDQHIANWLIGQVLDETADEAAMLTYADRIGADPAQFRTALHEVTRMPRAQFEKIAQFLHLIGNQLSKLALRNLQQARFITERERLEEQLRQAQKLEAIGQLAGGVAHDFNNILTAQFMELGLLAERTDLPADIKESVTSLQNGARMAADLTRQLLAFSRRQVLQVKQVELNDLLRNLLKLFRRVIGENIELALQGAAAPVWIAGDPSMVEQVVLNLVVNARNAMPQGGTLRIVLTAVEVSAAESALQPERRPGCFARISVRDSGCGMSAETLQRIFEPFFTTKAPGVGTGLGLSTVYGIVKQHQGWVEVTSRPGAGSEFQVFFPTIEPPGDPAMPAARQVERPATGNCLALVVEDEAPVRKLLSLLLRREGCRVLAAANADEALALWQQHRGEIRLLFSDVVMPGGLDGRELATRLVAEQPDLRVVLSSGYSLDLRNLGLPAGHVTFLAKPYDTDKIAAVLRDLGAVRRG